MSKLLTTTIVASKWACGGRKTQLVNKDGTMCCLGFDAVQRGVSSEEIGSSASPLDCGVEDGSGAVVPSSTTLRYQSAWKKRLTAPLADQVEEILNDTLYNDRLENAAIAINDSKRCMTKRERADLLRPVFKAAGRKIRFIDDEQPKQQRTRK